MLSVRWDDFGVAVIAQAKVDAARLRAVGRKLGISHATMSRAAQGRALSAEVYLTLCHWLKVDPMWFCTEETNDG